MKQYLFSLLLLAGCKSEVEAAKDDCEMVQLDVETVRQGVVKTPATGLIVEESHYVTKEDDMSGYPKTDSSGITKHLELSKAYLMNNYAKAPSYASKWERVWTPSESGNIGQGARGNLKPPLEHELFQANMYFKQSSFPPIGEKWIIKNAANNKAVVVSMGWELGPSGQKFIAGTSVETHFFLGSDNDSQLTIGKLKNQENVKYGPIECK
jgi:hypothetical protein